MQLLQADIDNIWFIIHIVGKLINTKKLKE